MRRFSCEAVPRSHVADLVPIYSESVFGYITVLPGAFSAYRYIALQNDSVGDGPLQKYFLGEKMVSPLDFCRRLSF